MLVVLVALLVIGPKDLPRVLRVVGKWVGKARGVAAHFRSGFDEMIRQSELEELEKKWKAENERIMRAHPAETPVDPRAEWKQMFEDVYRFQRDFFYDKDMHGVDWPAMKTRYVPNYNPVERAQNCRAGRMRARGRRQSSVR